MPQEKRRKQNYSLFGGVNQKTSQYNKTDAQVDDLRNMDFNIPNALSKRPGSTQMVTTGTSGLINSIYEFEKLSGASYLVASSNTALFYLNSGAWTEISSGYTNDQAFDFQTFTDKLYMANGQTYMYWTGESLFALQLQSAIGVSRGNVGLATGWTLPFWGLAQQVFTVDFAVSVLDIHGRLSPIVESLGTASIGYNATLVAISSGLSYFVNPLPSGATKLAVYAYAYEQESGGYNPAGVKFGEVVPISAYRFLTFASLTTNLVNFCSGAMDFTDIYENNAGFTGPPFSFGSTYIPKFIDINQNRMIMSGFSNAPSVSFFSEIAKPSFIYPENFFEIRTDDGDVITGQKSFNDEVIYFKLNSFHKLIGDNPDNYVLKEITTEYGCISDKAIAEYDEKLQFLDKKGIVEYNGANWGIISTPIEPIIRRMNLSAARDKAIAIHNQYRNQIWYGIPIDDSTENNITLVYDYLLNAWTFFEGFNPASFGLIKQSLDHEHLWFGDYSGLVHYSSPSFYGDNGAAISTLIETKFDAPDGNDVENMYRRLFLDVNTVSGITGVIDVDIYSNYNKSTVQHTFSIYQNQFQTREDFGVGSRSIAFKISHASASLPLTVYGYTVHRRFLRNV